MLLKKPNTFIHFTLDAFIQSETSAITIWIL